MYNCKFVEFETTIEIDNREIFEQMMEGFDLGTKQGMDLYKNFNPLLHVDVFLHMDYETGEILGYETQSYSDCENCVENIGIEKFNQLKGEWNEEEEDEFHELQYRSF